MDLLHRVPIRDLLLTVFLSSLGLLCQYVRLSLHSLLLTPLSDRLSLATSILLLEQSFLVQQLMVANHSE